MTTETREQEHAKADAIKRMRRALVLLDRAGLPVAACHLQLAIDVAGGQASEHSSDGAAAD